MTHTWIDGKLQVHRLPCFWCNYMAMGVDFDEALRARGEHLERHWLRYAWDEAKVTEAFDGPGRKRYWTRVIIRFLGNLCALLATAL